MLAPALQRRMNLLALVAILLLAVLPTTGRLLAGSPNPDGVWAQICTMAGLKLVRIAPGDANPLGASTLGSSALGSGTLGSNAPGANPFDAGPLDDSPHPTPPAGSGMGAGDCAYCPVLAGMALLLLCLVAAAPAAARRVSVPWRLHAPRVFPHPSGLGSRGPPLAL